MWVVLARREESASVGPVETGDGLMGRWRSLWGGERSHESEMEGRSRPSYVRVNVCNCRWNTHKNRRRRRRWWWWKRNIEWTWITFFFQFSLMRLCLDQVDAVRRFSDFNFELINVLQRELSRRIWAPDAFTHSHRREWVNGELRLSNQSPSPATFNSTLFFCVRISVRRSE